jgi:polyisoprenoid-binding protein YceI
MLNTTGSSTVWVIDPKHTLVEFAVSYLSMTAVRGRFAGVSGALRIDADDITRSIIDVEIDAASLDTGEPQRNAHLRSSDFLNVEYSPSILFRSTRIELPSADQLRIEGDLTIRETTRPIAFDAHYNGHSRNPDGHEIIGYTAHARIRRQDFGLTWNQTLDNGGLLVGDNVDILLEVQAIREE